MAFTPISQLKNKNSTYIEKAKSVTELEFKSLLGKAGEEILVVKPNLIKGFTIGDQDSMKNYKPYVELLSQRFVVPKVKNMGLSISINADFQTNDVSFALSRVEDSKYLNHDRVEDGKRLVVESIHGGEYELVIYAH